ncbi:Carnitine O-acetyltransferase mitochondrial [Mortierella hygrophila]|uniref:Carnitine O-acetyltransferase mitochondrial n=1 Tax=Mortierella hygrophila TaxID=979708 RepID=A0A9P6F971_9FUNG|nr:Carnitine O-acetyltransferase mitochondrial [Mortierella hygrophila]
MPPHITNNNKRAPMISLFATAPLPDLNKSATNSPDSSPTLGALSISATPPPFTLAQECSIMDKGQDKLPNLPIPPLEQTLARYLDTVRPLTTDQEYERTVAAVKDFQGQGPSPKGLLPLGVNLDKRLREHASECEERGTSWLAEWWDDWAYFTHRDPSTFFVNYYFGFQDDPRMPTQTARAALLVSLALEFRQLIVTRTLTPDLARNAPFCMNMYQYLFNYSRIAGPSADSAVGFPAETNNHICVVRNGKFYIFETLHLPSKPSSVLSPREIMIQLERIKKMADDDKSSVPEIGILSTTHRDQAAKDRVTLFEAHTSNKAHMAKIETSMFVLCLDSSSPSTSEEFSRACWHGDGASRWFDKCFQLIVFANGRAGMNGEHSKMDATPTSRLCRFMIDEAQARNLPDFRNLNAEDLYECASALDKPQPLNFITSSALDRAIANAHVTFKETVDAHQMVPTEFKGYGKGLIKAFKMSPDAYVQMALQLAYYRKHGELVATYESAATRKYRHGRTETARSCSIESKAFCEAMDNPDMSLKARAAACRAAVARHAQYTAWAVDGQAVDRHLLGLRLIRRPEEEVPAMFQDPVFARTCRWRLSTSQISDDCFIAYGWGEVVPDGYGCAYMVKETELYFCVTSLGLGSKEFGQHIAEALEDMRFTFEEVRKIEKAEAAEAALAAAAAAAEAARVATEEREKTMAAAVANGEESTNMVLPMIDTTTPGFFGSGGVDLISRSPSPPSLSKPAPRTSLFFQKDDPVLRTALARNAMAMAQEKYWSGIDDIAFDDVTPGSPKAKTTRPQLPTNNSTSISASSASLLSNSSSSSASTQQGNRTRSSSQLMGGGGRPRSDSGAKRTFMAILMGEDSVLGRLRSRRANSNLSNSSNK